MEKRRPRKAIHGRQGLWRPAMWKRSDLERLSVGGQKRSRKNSNWGEGSLGRPLIGEDNYGDWE